jgi:hypothetical protein
VVLRKAVERAKMGDRQKMEAIKKLQGMERSPKGLPGEDAPLIP